MTVRILPILRFTLLATAFAAAGCDPSNDESDGSGNGDEDSSDPGPWDRQSFRIDIPQNNWTDPRGIGSEIGAYVPAFFLRFGESADGEVELLLGSGDPGADEQNPCSSTISIKLESPDTPNEFGPVTLEAQLTSTAGGTTATVTANIYDLTFKDIFPVDGKTSKDGVLTAVVDFREMAPLFTLLPDGMRTAENVCAGLQQSFSAPCEPCSYTGGDDEPFCLEMTAMGLGAVDTDIEIEPNPNPSCD